MLSPHLPRQSYVLCASSSPPGPPSSAPLQAPVARHPAIPPPPAEITTSCQKPASLSLCLRVCAETPDNRADSSKKWKRHLAGSCCYLT